MKTLFLAGFGDLAQQTLRQLTLSLEAPVRFVIGCRQIDKTVPFINTTRFAALQIGHAHQYDSVYFDVDNADQCSETLAKIKPDLIYSTMSRQAWWVIFDRLPAELSENLKQAQLGPWLPMHLAPVYGLMKAVRSSGLLCPVINAAFPDAVNPALAGVGLAPACGIGNVANNIPGLRMTVSEKLNVPVQDVIISFVAAHYVSHKISRQGNAGSAPYALHAFVKGEDVTSHFATDELFEYLPHAYKRVGGKPGQPMTSASAVSILKAFLDDIEMANLHAPGPVGLAGGYPISIRNNKVTLRLPQDVSHDKACAINENGMNLDGIEKIADGKIWFRDSEMEIMRKNLGYTCQSMHVDDAPLLAEELTERFAFLNGDRQIVFHQSSAIR